jgi:hypothetical protein
MSEDAVVSPEEAKSIARRVLAIERVVLRRAWGWAYAVAAAVLRPIIERWNFVYCLWMFTRLWRPIYVCVDSPVTPEENP